MQPTLIDPTSVSVGRLSLTQLPKLLIALRAVSFGTRQVKKHPEGPPCGDAISYTRTNTRSRYIGQGVREVRSTALGRLRKRVPPDPSVQGRAHERVFRLAERPKSWKQPTRGPRRKRPRCPEAFAPAMKGCGFECFLDFRLVREFK